METEERKDEPEGQAALEESNSKVPLWARITDGLSLEIFVKNIPFMLFIAGLGAIYITNNSKASDLVRALDKKNKELKELNWEYMDVHSRLVYATSEAELIKSSGAGGLKALEKPAFEIKNTVVIEKRK